MNKKQEKKGWPAGCGTRGCVGPYTLSRVKSTLHRGVGPYVGAYGFGTTKCFRGRARGPGTQSHDRTRQPTAFSPVDLRAQRSGPEIETLENHFLIFPLPFNISNILVLIGITVSKYELHS